MREDLTERSLVDRCVRSIKFGAIAAAYVACIGIGVGAAFFCLITTLDVLTRSEGANILYARIPLAWWFPFAGLAVGALAAAGAHFIAEVSDRMR